jgi:surface antigen
MIMVMPVNTGRGSCNSQLVGTILGGTTGGLVGAAAAGRRDRLAGFAAGTVVGMLVGGAIGHSMDQADKYCVNQTLETAPDGTSIHWNRGNEQYTVTPVRTGQDENGNYCREYQTQAQVAGKTQQVYGTACRKPDGSWQIIN